MPTLTRESRIQEVAEALHGRALSPLRHALWSTSGERSGSHESLADRINPKKLAEHQIASLGDLLTPEGEQALRSLVGAGPKSMIAMQDFLTEKGLSPEWPATDRAREHSHEKAMRIRRNRGAGLNLTDAIEEADRQHAARTGEPVGEFSRKIKENAKAQEAGARLKGRRTL
jgi:hypothetical protein